VDNIPKGSMASSGLLTACRGLRQRRVHHVLVSRSGPGVSPSINSNVISSIGNGNRCENTRCRAAGPKSQGLKIADGDGRFRWTNRNISPAATVMTVLNGS
jgi:hypothetical protein